jgi:hypothetical protein
LFKSVQILRGPLGKILVSKPPMSKGFGFRKGFNLILGY